MLPVAFAHAATMAAFVLYESALGYALFSITEAEDIGIEQDAGSDLAGWLPFAALTSDVVAPFSHAVQASVTDLAKFGKICKLHVSACSCRLHPPIIKQTSSLSLFFFFFFFFFLSFFLFLSLLLQGFSAFKSAKDALENINNVSEGNCTEVLKNFLETSLPAAKAMKKQDQKLGVAHPTIGQAISEATGIPCTHGNVVNELLRGVRLHFSKLIKSLSESANVERAQVIFL